MIASVGFPQIANQVGWMTAEIGRQPWVVYGLLRTHEGISSTIVASQVMRSIVMFLVIYLLLLALFLYLLDHKIKHGPDPVESPRLEKQPIYRDPFQSETGGGV
jgi:cytochrome d ubiquinol oxidase subunit I